MSVESTSSLNKAMSHWANEIKGALQAGKTVFVIMGEYTEDLGTLGSTLNKNQRTYSTFQINNYQALPVKLSFRNARGQKIVTTDAAFRGLYEVLNDIVEYRVIITSNVTKKVYTTKDGATIGCVLKHKDYSGAIVLLPYFSFNDLTEQGEDEELVWTEGASNTSKALIGQLVAIDKLVRGSTERTPPPGWVGELEPPAVLASIDQTIADLKRRIGELQQQGEEQAALKAGVLEFSHLLYENGKILERAIEKALRLLGYAAETLRIGELEIDHVILGPSGKRMIGESEGKDNSAIDITKFRQLESNIGEDFQRDEVDEPAKGLLFGNGFRLTTPGDRPEQFTQKSLTNAKRLGSALIRTADLYPVITYLLDHPDDEAFKLACRSAIEETTGAIVEFPDPERNVG